MISGSFAATSVETRTRIPSFLNASGCCSTGTACRLFCSEPRFSHYFHIKRFQLPLPGCFNGSADITRMNHLCFFSSGSEFAFKVPEIKTFRQLFITLSLQVLIDITLYSLYLSVRPDFRVCYCKCFFHTFP